MGIKANWYLTSKLAGSGALWRLLSVGVVMLSMAWLSACANDAQLPAIERVVAFGDSNVDNGNLLRITGQKIPAPPRWKGRESNGPVVVEYLARFLHARLESYAVSGATSGESNSMSLLQPQFAARFEGLKATGLSGQVERFIRDGGTLHKSDLVVIWAGSNDLFGAASPDILSQRITEASANFERVIELLHKAGGRRMLVVNRTPRDKIGLPNDQAGMALNAAMAQVVKRASSLFGSDIQLFDAYAAVSDMVRNPQPYGLSETMAWCMTTPACVTEKFDDGLAVAESFINWDGAHKTTKVHRLMARQMLRLVVGAAACRRDPSPASSPLGSASRPPGGQPGGSAADFDPGCRTPAARPGQRPASQ